MQRLQYERNSKFWRWQNFITTLLLAWMFLASLAGGFYVGDAVVNGSLQKVSMYKLKKIFLFPAWTSLTLLNLRTDRDCFLPTTLLALKGG